MFVQGDRYYLAAAITTAGYIATTVVPGSIDSFDFYTFIAEEVVSSFSSDCLLACCEFCIASSNEPIPCRMLSFGTK